MDGPYHVVSHIGFIPQEDVVNAKTNRGALEFSPYVWYPSPIIDIVEGVFGETRMEDWYPIRRAVDSGAVVTAASDWPIIPDVNPWVGIETLVTRSAVGKLGKPHNPEHRITLKEAFDFYTINAACLLYTSPSPRDATLSRMPSSA